MCVSFEFHGHEFHADVPLSKSYIQFDMEIMRVVNHVVHISFFVSCFLLQKMLQKQMTRDRLTNDLLLLIASRMQLGNK